MNKITKLELEYQFNDIEFDAFSNLENLLELDIKLRYWNHNKMLVNLNKLQVLTVSTHIFDDMRYAIDLNCENLANLNELNLWGFKIETNSFFKCLKNLKNLQKLHLDYCKLTKLEQSFEFNNIKCLHIKELNVDDVDIEILFEKADFNNLEELSIATYKNIFSLNKDVFNGFPRLKKLSFKRLVNSEYNSITSYLEFLSENSSSSFNSLNAGTFADLTDLEMLHLIGNKFSALDSGIFNTNLKLKNLNLSNNNLIDLDSNMLQNLVHLEVLDLSLNKLKRIDPNLFVNLVNLKKLNLSRR